MTDIGDNSFTITIGDNSFTITIGDNSFTITIGDNSFRIHVTIQGQIQGFICTKGWGFALLIISNF